MDRLEVMRLYTRIVDRRSFTLAAQALEVPMLLTVLRVGA
jgi:hypothetical protein